LNIAFHFTNLDSCMSALWLSFLLAGQSASEPRFALHSVHDSVVPGIVETMDASGAITIVGHRAVPGADVIALRRLDGLRPGFPREPQLVLANGDRILGKPIAIEGSFLILRADGNRADGERLRFPLTSSSILWLRSPATVDRERLHGQLQGERGDDQIILQNGDVLAGVLTGIDSAKGELIFEVNGAKRSLLIAKVAAVAFSTKLARPRRPTGPYWLAVTSNGTRMTLVSATIERGMLRGRTMYKDPVQFALSDLTALDVYQGKAEYLSDLKPAKYEYRTWQGETHSWFADRSLHGSELQLQSAAGITTFDKGIATHGACSLTYELDGKYQRLDCQIGLDPRLGMRGNAIVRVLVDGREFKVNDGKPLTLATGIVPIRVDASKARELKLVVEWGDGGNVADVINWGDARLIR
jgi:NPCBM/NEW2 domain